MRLKFGCNFFLKSYICKQTSNSWVTAPHRRYSHDQQRLGHDHDLRNSVVRNISYTVQNLISHSSVCLFTYFSLSVYGEKGFFALREFSFFVAENCVFATIEAFFLLKIH